MVGTGEALLNVRAKGGQAVQAGDAQVNVPTEQDFDFQSELQKFDKVCCIAVLDSLCNLCTVTELDAPY